MTKSITHFVIYVMFVVSCETNKSHNKLTNETDNQVNSVSLKEDFKVSNSKEIDKVSYKIYHISKHSLQELFNETTEEYDNFSCFYFDIALDNSTDIVSFPSVNYVTLNDKIQYLSFLIKEDLKIHSNGKLYNCLNSTFDRTYGKSESSRFFLVFEKINSKEILFQFDDNYFNNGTVQLKLKI